MQIIFIGGDTNSLVGSRIYYGVKCYSAQCVIVDIETRNSAIQSIIRLERHTCSTGRYSKLNLCRFELGFLQHEVQRILKIKASGTKVCHAKTGFCPQERGRPGVMLSSSAENEEEMIERIEIRHSLFHSFDLDMLISTSLE